MERIIQSGETVVERVDLNYGQRSMFNGMPLAPRWREVRIPTLFFKGRDITKIIYSFGVGHGYGVLDLHGYGIIVYEVSFGAGCWTQGQSYLRQYHIAEDFTMIKLAEVELVVDTKKFELGSGKRVTHHERAVTRELPISSSFDEDSYKFSITLGKFDVKTNEMVSSRVVALDISRQFID